MKEICHSIPPHLRPQDEGQSRLFENNWLERITRTSLWVPVLIYCFIVCGFIYYALAQTILEPAGSMVLFVSGAFTWTLAEYWIHRIGYHSQTDLKWWLKIQHLGHGVHHQHPKDSERLAMPPVPALLLSILLFGLFWLIGGIYAIAFFPGFLLGYTLYIIMHYSMHRYKAPNFLSLKKLWKHHALHHYKYPENKAFGVSTRLWDYVFGTMPG